MLVLVIDTAGSTGGVLLARNESNSCNPAETKILGAGVLQPREFSTQLVSSISELFETNRSALSEVDVFAIVSGPGSFTGLRVGISAVKAMAEVMAKPVIALSRLAVMASQTKVSVAGPVHAVLDAGRGEFYHGIYRDVGWTCVAESLQTSTTLAVSLRDSPGAVLACESTVLDALRAVSDIEPCQIPCVSVHETLPLVLAAWQARRFTDVALLDANYLRRMTPAIRSKADIPVEPADARATRP